MNGTRGNVLARALAGVAAAPGALGEARGTGAVHRPHAAGIEVTRSITSASSICFRATVTMDDVERLKPDPEGLHFLLGKADPRNGALPGRQFGRRAGGAQRAGVPFLGVLPSRQRSASRARRAIAPPRRARHPAQRQRTGEVLEMRSASLRRTTTETDIRLRLNLDGRGRARRLDRHSLSRSHAGAGGAPRRDGSGDRRQGRSGRGSAPHRRGSGHRARRGRAQALGSKRGILRAGYFLMPMDETLASVAIDFSGRRALRLPVEVFGAQRGRSADRTGRGFLSRLRAGGRGERAFAAAVRPVDRIIRWRRSSRRSRARCDLRPRAIPQTEARAAEHEGA